MNTKNPAPAKNQAQAASLYPNKPGFKPAKPVVVGGEILMNAPIEYNTGRKTVKLVVRNTGDRPIQVGSHIHFFEVNARLRFDRRAAWGMRLDIPSGTAVRFEPGETKTVRLTAIGGSREGYGLNALCSGPMDDPAVRKAAFEKAQDLGFLGMEDDQ